MWSPSLTGPLYITLTPALLPVEGFQLPATLRGFLVKRHKKIKLESRFFFLSLTQLVIHTPEIPCYPRNLSRLLAANLLLILFSLLACPMNVSPTASPFSLFPSVCQVCSPHLGCVWLYAHSLCIQQAEAVRWL